MKLYYLLLLFISLISFVVSNENEVSDESSSEFIYTGKQDTDNELSLMEIEIPEKSSKSSGLKNFFRKISPSKLLDSISEKCNKGKRCIQKSKKPSKSLEELENELEQYLEAYKLTKNPFKKLENYFKAKMIRSKINKLIKKVKQNKIFRELEEEILGENIPVLLPSESNNYLGLYTGGVESPSKKLSVLTELKENKDSNVLGLRLGEKTTKDEVIERIIYSKDLEGIEETTSENKNIRPIILEDSRKKEPEEDSRKKETEEDSRKKETEEDSRKKETEEESIKEIVDEKSVKCGKFGCKSFRSLFSKKKTPNNVESELASLEKKYNECKIKEELAKTRIARTYWSKKCKKIQKSIKDYKINAPEEKLEIDSNKVKVIEEKELSPDDSSPSKTRNQLQEVDEYEEEYYASEEVPKYVMSKSDFDKSSTIMMSDLSKDEIESLNTNDIVYLDESASNIGDLDPKLLSEGEISLEKVNEDLSTKNTFEEGEKPEDGKVTRLVKTYEKSLKSDPSKLDVSMRDVSKLELEDVSSIAEQNS